MTRRTARGGRTVLGWLLAWALLLALALATTGAWAEEARVVIYPPRAAGPLVKEALIRIRAELRAVGLKVDVYADGPGSPERPQEGTLPLERGDYGVIVLSQQQARIDIRAYAPGLETPVSQSAHTSYPGVDAEVVAVRAVEALRAAMIQFARNRETEDALPASVSDFTRLTAPPAAAETAERQPAAPERPAQSPPASPPRSTTTNAPALSIWFGPVGFLELPARQVLVGAQGALWWHPSWFRLGVSAQRTFGGGRLVEPEGSADLERSSLYGWLGAEHALSPAVFAYIAAGGGFVHYQARSEGADGFASAQAAHASPAVGLRAGAGIWLTSHFGLYTSLGAETLTHAPRLRFDGRDVALVGRPSTSFTLGVMFGP